MSCSIRFRDTNGTHKWDQGVLQLLVRRVTGDASAIPFSVCKRDYPCQTADYLLWHKVGSSIGRHTSGRYTRWARQFSRNYSRILRRLIRLSERGRFRILGTDRRSRSFNVPSSNLPNSPYSMSCLEGSTAEHGKSKRHKPGRISCPLQEKYCTAVYGLLQLCERYTVLLQLGQQ